MFSEIGIRIITRGRVVAIALIALLVGSCAPTGTSIESSNARFLASAVDIYFTGYDVVTTNYVDPVPASSLALAALSGLNRLDQGFRVVQRSNRLALIYNGRSVGELIAPEADDVDGWAQTTAMVIDLARVQSATLGTVSDDQLFEATLDAMTESLDRYSRFENRREQP